MHLTIFIFVLQLTDMTKGDSKQMIKRDKSTRDNQNTFYLHPNLFQAFSIDPHLSSGGTAEYEGGTFHPKKYIYGLKNES